MQKLPANIIANADDLGLNSSVNSAILHCYQQGYINSTSLLTNTSVFEATAHLIHQNPCITNIGVHINLAEGSPVTTFKQLRYLDANGCWNIDQTNKKLSIISTADKEAFEKEISAQIDKAIAAKIPITHLDSHYHLHTLPCFFNLFIQAARHYGLKLRLAQTYNEGSFLKFTYRQYINRLFKKNNIAYTEYFESVDHFLQNPINTGPTEVMLHPDFDLNGKLTDHYDAATMTKWINFAGKTTQ